MSTIRRLPRLIAGSIAVLAGIYALNACQRATYSLLPATSVVAPLAPAQVAGGEVKAVSRIRPSTKQLPLAKRTKDFKNSRLPAKRRAESSSPQLVMAATATVIGEVRPCLQKNTPASVEFTEPSPKQRSRVVAVLLAVLSVTYVPLSLHNFYLGYYGRGALAVGLLVVGSYLLVFGTVGLLSASSSLTGVGVLGLGILTGWLCWQLADVVRIITGNLRPKNGSYRQRSQHP
jgi:hypothetical protein